MQLDFKGCRAQLDFKDCKAQQVCKARLVTPELKVTPAFNTEMCERFGVKQLIFDGKSDALFHEFDRNSQRHMEYVNDRGWFLDPPIGQLLEDFRTTYPKLWQSSIDRKPIRDAAFDGGR